MNQAPVVGRNLLGCWSTQAQYSSMCPACGGVVDVGEPLERWRVGGLRWVHQDCKDFPKPRNMSSTGAKGLLDRKA